METNNSVVVSENHDNKFVVWFDRSIHIPGSSRHTATVNVAILHIFKAEDGTVCYAFPGERMGHVLDRIFERIRAVELVCGSIDKNDLYR